MKYQYIQVRLTPGVILDLLDRADIPITDVSVAEGYTKEGEPFVEISLRGIELTSSEEKKIDRFLRERGAITQKVSL